MNILDLSPSQLRQAADLQERIQRMQAELTQLLGPAAPTPAPAVAAPTQKRRLSARAIANIRAGALRRWSGKAASAVTTQAAPKKVKRRLSPAARKAIADSVAARWAKARAAGRSHL